MPWGSPEGQMVVLGHRSQGQHAGRVVCSSMLVFVGYLIGQPMDLHFTFFEVVAIVLAVTAVSHLTSDGECHWMEGSCWWPST